MLFSIWQTSNSLVAGGAGMILTSEELETVRRARREQEWWRYERAVILIAAIGAIGFGFWLVYGTKIEFDPWAHWIVQPMFVVAGLALGALPARWGDRQRLLLLKLASSLVDDAE